MLVSSALIRSQHTMCTWVSQERRPSGGDNESEDEALSCCEVTGHDVRQFTGSGDKLSLGHTQHHTTHQFRHTLCAFVFKGSIRCEGGGFLVTARLTTVLPLSLLRPSGRCDPVHRVDGSRDKLHFGRSFGVRYSSSTAPIWLLREGGRD